jgi:hypothetical protein
VWEATARASQGALGWVAQRGVIQGTSLTMSEKYQVSITLNSSYIASIPNYMLIELKIGVTVVMICNRITHGINRSYGKIM